MVLSACERCEYSKMCHQSATGEITASKATLSRRALALLQVRLLHQRATISRRAVA